MTHRTHTLTNRIPNSDLFEEVQTWLASQHSVTLRVVGHSMYPFLTNRRDRVVLQSPSPRLSLACGQIVLARLPQGSYVLHRIIRLEGSRITLMGDGHWRQREHCSTTDIIGIVTSILRPDGRTVTCSARSERIKVHLWLKLLPLRRYLLLLLCPRHYFRAWLNRQKKQS